MEVTPFQLEKIRTDYLAKLGEDSDDFAIWTRRALSPPPVTGTDIWMWSYPTKKQALLLCRAIDWTVAD